MRVSVPASGKRLKLSHRRQSRHCPVRRARDHIIPRRLCCKRVESARRPAREDVAARLCRRRMQRVRQAGRPAALIVPESQVRLKNVGINPLRTGILECVREMGGEVTLLDMRDVSGEPVADIAVAASALRGIDVPAARAPSMIDEYPILAVAAACASGDTVFKGVGELRVKESDRLSAISAGLGACGVVVTEANDSLTIHGTGRSPKGGGVISAHSDHRIAMSFLVLGMVSEQPVTVDDCAMITTSFPGFVSLMNGAGAQFEENSIRA